MFSIFSFVSQQLLILFFAQQWNPKLFWPTVKKKCCSDRDKLSKFEAEGGSAKRQIQADTTRYNQIQPDTTRYNQIQPDTSRYNQIRPDTTRYKQIQTDTNRYN